MDLIRACIRRRPIGVYTSRHTHTLCTALFVLHFITLCFCPTCYNRKHDHLLAAGHDTWNKRARARKSAHSALRLKQKTGAAEEIAPAYLFRGKQSRTTHTASQLYREGKAKGKVIDIPVVFGEGCTFQSHSIMRRFAVVLRTAWCAEQDR